MELLAEFAFPTLVALGFVAYCVACLYHAPRNYREYDE